MLSIRSAFSRGLRLACRRAPGSALGLALGLVLVAAPASAISTVQDQSDLDLSTAFVISGYLAADDLNFAGSSRIDTVTVWLTDSVVNNNGILDGFSGTLSWGIYTDDDPGPGYLAYSGTDPDVNLVDTGLQTTSGSDVFRARIDLNGQPIVGPARVWLVIHEGTWGSAGDGSSIYWITSSAIAGSGAYLTGNEVNPTPAEWLVSNYDAAFVVESDPHAWYQGGLDNTGGGNISNFVSATDFTLPTARTLGGLDVWIGDFSAPEDGYPNNFGGSMSWGIYANAAGGPGTLVASGVDATLQLMDSGINLAGGGDIARVRMELRPRPHLAAGTYWLALHEGLWGSPWDTTIVYWIRNPSFVSSTSRQAADETNPGSWYELFPDHDLAFVLYDDEIFSSGFDAGSTCAWSAVSGGFLCP